MASTQTHSQHSKHTTFGQEITPDALSDILKALDKIVKRPSSSGSFGGCSNGRRYRTKSAESELVSIPSEANSDDEL